MSRCLECLNLDLQGNPRHANVGFGHCKHAEPGRFYSVNRPACERFKDAAPDVVGKRITWWNNKQRKT